MTTDNRDALAAEVLRLYHFEDSLDGTSIRLIARKLKLARKTVCTLLGARPREARVGRRRRGVGDSRDARRQLHLVSSR